VLEFLQRIRLVGNDEVERMYRIGLCKVMGQWESRIKDEEELTDGSVLLLPHLLYVKITNPDFAAASSRLAPLVNSPSLPQYNSNPPRKYSNVVGKGGLVR